MPMINEDYIRLEIKRLISELTERDLDEIGDTTLFRDELGVDSLTALEVMFAVDKKFGISIPDDEYHQLSHVNDTVALVLKYLPQEALSGTAA